MQSSPTIRVSNKKKTIPQLFNLINETNLAVPHFTFPPTSIACLTFRRNDVYGLENSFLEAEYHCRPGFELRYPNANGNNSNLICRKSRWIGKRPSCVRIKRPPLSLSPSSSAVSASASSSPSPASSLNEAATFVTSRARENNGTKLCGKKHNCQQACFVKDDNVTRVCSCFKGFKMVDGRCVGK